MGCGQKLKKAYAEHKLLCYGMLLLLLLGVYLHMPQSPLRTWAWQKLPYAVQCDRAAPSWLQALLPLFKQHGYVGIQISYVNAHGQALQCNVGWASVWPPRRMQSDDTLRYASISKIFTSALILQRIQAGHLQFEDNILAALKLPYTADAPLAKVTLAQLMRHRAGFDSRVSGDWVFMPQQWCPTQLQRLSTLKLDFAPNQRFAYSNFGYCLLGEVIRQQYAAPDLPSVYQKQLFQPLQVQIQPITAQAQGSVDYFYHPQDQNGMRNFPYANSTAYGGFVGSAHDFSKVLQQIMADPYLKQQLSAVHPDCELSRWQGCHGYAQYIYQQPAQQRSYWRNGSLPGLTALSMYFEDQSSIVLLANGRGGNPTQENQQLGQLLYKLLAQDTVH